MERVITPPETAVFDPIDQHLRRAKVGTGGVETIVYRLDQYALPAEIHHGKAYFVVLSLLMLLFLYLLNLLFNPYDWVEVAIDGLPTDTEFVCVVTESQHEVKTMNWYSSKVFPFTTHPDSHGASYVGIIDFEVNTQLRRHAAWVASDRVGILRKSKMGRWQIAWYNPPKVDLKGRSFFFGGGRWEVRWRDADDLQEPTPSLLRSMGFDYALKEP